MGDGNQRPADRLLEESIDMRLQGPGSGKRTSPALQIEVYASMSSVGRTADRASSRVRRNRGLDQPS